MTPGDFIGKWRGAELTERSAAQSHFIDLWRMLGEPAPTDADPKGEWYAFEKGAPKTGGGNGWADVWKRHCFAWEYKRDHANLQQAYGQLQRYAVALENPPLLIVADTKRIEVHTNWTNTINTVHALTRSPAGRLRGAPHPMTTRTTRATSLRHRMSTLRGRTCHSDVAIVSPRAATP
jgi:hypothetical protein